MEEKSIYSNKKRNMQDDEYKSTAPIYDLLFSRGLSSIRRNICTFLKHEKATKILDLCCGTGEQLRLLNDNNMLLTGVDMSPAMLAEASQKSPSSIQYIETDAANIPLPDNEYDGIIISLALHEKSTAQHEAIFSEACRLLKHNGLMIIADYCTPTTGFASQVVGKILIPGIERAAGLAHYHNYKNWISRGAIEGFLQKKSPGKHSLIASHFKDCIQIVAVHHPHDEAWKEEIMGGFDEHDKNENNQ